MFVSFRCTSSHPRSPHATKLPKCGPCHRQKIHSCDRGLWSGEVHKMISAAARSLFNTFCLKVINFLILLFYMWGLEHILLILLAPLSLPTHRHEEIHSLVYCCPWANANFLRISDTPSRHLFDNLFTEISTARWCCPISNNHCQFSFEGVTHFLRALSVSFGKGPEHIVAFYEQLQPNSLS